MPKIRVYHPFPPARICNMPHLRPAKRFPFPYILFTSFILHPSSFTQASSRPDVPLPHEVVQVVQRVRRALEAGDRPALEALASAPAELKWLDLRERPGRPVWKFTVLALPTHSEEPTTYLGLFYDYHTCESIGDHFHRMVRTEGDWRIGPEIPETDTLG